MCCNTFSSGLNLNRQIYSLLGFLLHNAAKNSHFMQLGQIHHYRGTLDDFVKTGYLPKKEVMSYRAPDPTEEKPQPKEGEVIVFTDHMNRGFRPPAQSSSEMFCTFLIFVLKTSDPIPCLTSATSKCSVRCTLEKSPAWNFSENTFT